MPNVFDIILAGCLVAVLCTFCNVIPWSWKLHVTTSASGFAAPEQQQQQQGHHHDQEHENDILYNPDILWDIAESQTVVSVDFEVFGKVQGVRFRKATQYTALKIGHLVGWVKNTDTGTIAGVVQGPQDKVARMKIWLEKVGSPKSKIEKTEFKNERTIDEFTDIYDDFTLVRRHKVPVTKPVMESNIPFADFQVWEQKAWLLGNDQQ